MERRGAATGGGWSLGRALMWRLAPVVVRRFPGDGGGAALLSSASSDHPATNQELHALQLRALQPQQRQCSVQRHTQHRTQRSSACAVMASGRTRACMAAGGATTQHLRYWRAAALARECGLHQEARTAGPHMARDSCS